MKTRRKNVTRFVIFLLLVVVMMLYLNQVFYYHDKSVWSTDYRVEQYQKLPENSVDVLFLGSSNLMSSVNPMQLWKETGIQSYAYCSRAQTFPFTYAYLQDALETQKPKVVVIDAYSVFSDKEAYGVSNTDFHFGINMDSLSMRAKTEILAKYVPKSEWLAYYFPLFKNHNYYKNWENPEDETDGIFMGYCYADGIEYFETPEYTAHISPMGETDGTYLQKIIQLCRENNTELMVIKTPVVYTDEEHSVLNCVKQFCEAEDILFYDMSMDAEEWGFDFGTDMLNYFHNNTTGAQKVTERIGALLTGLYDFSRSETHQYAEVWAFEYERMMAYRSTKPAE